MIENRSVIYPGTKVGRRVRLLRGNTKNFLCGDGTVLYPDCADSYLNLNLTQFHRTIITLHTAKQVHVKTAKIQILSVFELVVLYQCQLPDFIMYYGYIRYHHWGSLVEETQKFSILFLHILTSLKLFPNKNYKIE